MQRSMALIIFLILLLGEAHALSLRHYRTDQADLCCELIASNVDACASGKWQKLDELEYNCFSRSVDPQGVSLTSTGNPVATSKISRCEVPYRSKSDAQSDQLASSMLRTTGNGACSGVEPTKRHDKFGVASYEFGGKMASMYYAPVPVFRCNAVPPSNGYYVAFWTQFNGNAYGSQPQPLNCNRTIRITNKYLGRVADAVVIDRCASCVGVGHQLKDPTTPECTVNGATIDLSEALWNYLYAGAEPNVYDIEYSEDTYAGWSEDPALLEDVSTTQCGVC